MSGMEIEFDVAATMRDGTVLRSDVYRPTGEGPWPVLVQRTPYGRRAGAQVQHLDPFMAISRGYIVVNQDTRGRSGSDGEWFPFKYEVEDGYDTIRWAASLPGSSGEVGMFGPSYVGYTQWAAALGAPPELRAIAPEVTWSDPSLGGLQFRGGALELGNNAVFATINAIARAGEKEDLTNPTSAAALGELIADYDDLDREGYWGLPSGNLPVLARHGIKDLGMTRALVDPASAESATVAGKHHEVEVPSLNVGGWYDVFTQGTLDNHTAMVELGKPTRLIMGPWPHTAFYGGVPTSITGEVNFGLASMTASVGLDQMKLDWYDHWLKGIDNGVLEQPPVKIFVMGLNEWRDENEWPLSLAVDTPWHLGTGGTLSQSPPSSSEIPDHYVYDPADPVITRGGNLVMIDDYPAGQFDQRDIERRADVLTYTSEPLAENLEVTGRIRMRLHAATDAPSTDWVVRLCDVDTEGVSRNIVDGIVRVRGTSGEPAEHEIDLWSTSNVFLAGHRIRVQVTSSNFPRWDRNLNTGEPARTAVTMRTAQQTVFHDAERPSHIILPVVPASS